MMINMKSQGGGVHQLKKRCNPLPLDLQLFALTYNKVDNPYEHTLIKNTYTKGENIANIVDIYIGTTSETKKYDGKALESKGVFLVDGTLNDGDILIVDDTKPIPSITNVGSVDNILSAKVVNSSGEDHTSNYNITNTNCGVLEITKRDVTLTTEGFLTVYSGGEYSLPVVTISGDRFVDGEVNGVRCTGKFRDVGVYENKPIVIEWADEADPNNYNITYEYGTVTITAAIGPAIPTTGATVTGEGGTSSNPIRNIGDDGTGNGSIF